MKKIYLFTPPNGGPSSLERADLSVLKEASEIFSMYDFTVNYKTVVTWKFSSVYQLDRCNDRYFLS